MQKILVIQTAFIGDVVLATGIVEKLHEHYPDAEIDFLLRKGNESLLRGHPFIREVLIWNKDTDKHKNLINILKIIRTHKYDKVINIHRHASSGFLAAFSQAKETIGFNKNPLSFLFSKKAVHITGSNVHEIERNHLLIKDFTDDMPAQPRLHPSPAERENVRRYQYKPYITISPSSIWFTKQYPKEKWVSFLNKLPHDYNVYLLDAPTNVEYCEEIKKASDYPFIENLAGCINILESVALMQYAVMNYTNDSGPMHFASAVNAPVTAIFCSTALKYGFGPLSDQSFVVQVKESLPCRPCGVHGHKACPQKHFNCALHIKDKQLAETLFKVIPAKSMA